MLFDRSNRKLKHTIPYIAEEDLKEWRKYFDDKCRAYRRDHTWDFIDMRVSIDIPSKMKRGTLTINDVYRNRKIIAQSQQNQHNS